MPLIVVYGLRKDEYSSKSIALIEDCIVAAMLSVEELGLKKGDISFSFPSDPSIISMGLDAVIIVELLFDKPERTFEVKQRLAMVIARAFKKLMGVTHSVIEVAVKRFDPNKDGFARIDL